MVAGDEKDISKLVDEKTSILEIVNNKGTLNALIQEKTELILLANKKDDILKTLAQWTVKTQIGDLVHGVGLYNDGTDTWFGVHANRFFVTHAGIDEDAFKVLPDAEKAPFQIKNGLVVINSAMIGDLSADDITTGTLSADRISGDVRNATLLFHRADGQYFSSSSKPDIPFNASIGDFDSISFLLESDSGSQAYLVSVEVPASIIHGKTSYGQWDNKGIHTATDDVFIAVQAADDNEDRIQFRIYKSDVWSSSSKKYTFEAGHNSNAGTLITAMGFKGLGAISTSWGTTTAVLSRTTTQLALTNFGKALLPPEWVVGSVGYMRKIGIGLSPGNINLFIGNTASEPTTVAGPELVAAVENDPNFRINVWNDTRGESFTTTQTVDQ